MKKGAKQNRKSLVSGQVTKAVRFSALSEDAKKSVAKAAAKRLWKDYGSVIDKLAKE